MTDLPQSADFQEITMLPRPGLGHNQPPPFDPVLQESQIQARIKELHPELAERKERLLASAANAPDITDDDSAGKVTDYLGLVATFERVAESHRQADKEPFLHGGKAVDGYYKGLTGPVVAAAATLRQKLKSYIVDKEARARRKAEQEAEEARAAAQRAQDEADAAARKAAAAIRENAPEAPAAAAALESYQAKADIAENRAGEAIGLAKAATAKPADLARTRGIGGSLATSAQIWVVDSVDRDNLDLAALRQHFTMADLEKAARAWVKANTDTLKNGGKLAGASIREDRNLNIR